MNRQELAGQLDKDIDEFMEQLARNRQPKGMRKAFHSCQTNRCFAESTSKAKNFDLDEWWTEMEKHPMFMKQLDTSNMSSETEALQVCCAVRLVHGNFNA